MEKKEILRFLHGQIKKHGKNFSVVIKYRTNVDKIRKRYGEFVDLNGEDELYLYNRDKKASATYVIDRIEDIWRR